MPHQTSNGNESDGISGSPAGPVVVLLPLRQRRRLVDVEQVVGSVRQSRDYVWSSVMGISAPQLPSPPIAAVSPAGGHAYCLEEESVGLRSRGADHRSTSAESAARMTAFPASEKVTASSVGRASPQLHSTAAAATKRPFLRSGPSTRKGGPAGGMAEIRAGYVTATERVRYRNGVTKKLIDLHDEVTELYGCRENMSTQLLLAMRADPRYAKERNGEVRLAERPTRQQRQAVEELCAALKTLQHVCRETVSAYLSPEEKRFLGVNTHVFQTDEERDSTYQYFTDVRCGGSRRDTRKSHEGPERAAGGSVTSVEEKEVTCGANEVMLASAKESATTSTFTRGDDTNPVLPSVPTVSNTTVAVPPKSPLNTAAQSQTPVVMEETPEKVVAAADALHTSRQLSTSYSDTKAERTPERYFGPVDSVSSLGGTLSTTREVLGRTVAVPSAPAPVPTPPSSLTPAAKQPIKMIIRGPSGQLLVKIPGPAPVVSPQPIQAASAVAPFATPAVAPSSERRRPSTTAPPSAREERVSTTQGRAIPLQFQRFLIDTDSDSTAM